MRVEREPRLRDSAQRADGASRTACCTSSPRPSDRTQYTPIDYFLRSLAESAQDRAIGVILSGTASDGTAGVREIKAGGGITIAQDPGHARSTTACRARRSPADSSTWCCRPPRSPPSWCRSRAIRSQLPEQPRRADDRAPRGIGRDRAAHGAGLRPAARQPAASISATTSARPSSAGCSAAWCCTSSTARAVRPLPARESGRGAGALQDILIHVTRFFRDRESFEALAAAGAAAASPRRRPTTSRSASGCPAARPARRPIRSRSSLLEYLAEIERQLARSRSSPPTSASPPSSTRAPASTPRASPPTSRPSACAGSSPRSTAGTASTRPCATSASSPGRT